MKMRENIMKLKERKNILLIEPSYYAKYPPLGLMKIAYYHKEKRKDFVWFAKDKLPNKVSDRVREKLSESKYYMDTYGENLDNFIDKVDDTIKNNKWDRIYVSTLFTYEWQKTIECIKYAKQLIGDPKKVYVGGILATLMKPELEKATGVNVIEAQLVNSEMIGYDDGINIDFLTPDYSILDNTEYDYPVQNAYFTYATRGCGMNCEFCAVKTLEPKYESFISIKKQINEVKEKYGEKKDLLLMDNNVLKSDRLKDIIEEIRELKFHKGATYTNLKTNKKNNRYVDFNQGLDSLFFTKDKVEQLAKINLRPARIAFDHIDYKDSYVKAISLAEKHNITHLSNYLLYNGEEFSSKGKIHRADTPEDLYNRLAINVKLQEGFNEDRKKEEKELIHIFSFPMRYRPLDAKTRGSNKNSEVEEKEYVGANWNLKYLRAIQRILIPTQGKGVSSKSFFDKAFGKNVDEYLKILLMPEDYIATRGEPDKIRGISEEERNDKYKEFQLWENLRDEWENLYYNCLDDNEKNEFKKIIFKNEIDLDILIQIENSNIRKLYIHYFYAYSLLNTIYKLEERMEDQIREEVIKYICEESHNLLDRITKYVIETHTNKAATRLYFTNFKEKVVNKLLNVWIENNFDHDIILEMLENHGNLKIDIYHLKLIKWSQKCNLINSQEKVLIIDAIMNENNKKLSNILASKYDLIFKELERKLKGAIDSKELKKILKEIREDLSTQISFLNSEV
jgi:hypothetical protein